MLLNNSPYSCGVYLDLSRSSSNLEATTRTRSPRISLRISFRRGDPDASTRSALLKAATCQDTANLHKAVLVEAYAHLHTCVYSRKDQAQPRRHTLLTRSMIMAGLTRRAEVQRPRQLSLASGESSGTIRAGMKPRVQGEQHAIPTAMLRSNGLWPCAPRIKASIEAFKFVVRFVRVRPSVRNADGPVRSLCAQNRYADAKCDPYGKAVLLLGSAFGVRGTGHWLQHGPTAFFCAVSWGLLHCLKATIVPVWEFGHRQEPQLIELPKPPRCRKEPAGTGEVDKGAGAVSHADAARCNPAGDRGAGDNRRTGGPWQKF